MTSLTALLGARAWKRANLLSESAGSVRNEAVAPSTAIPVEVRTLIAGGALPVSVALPLVVLGALVLVRPRTRRVERRGARAT